jgi:hypothetical protein
MRMADLDARYANDPLIVAARAAVDAYRAAQQAVDNALETRHRAVGSCEPIVDSIGATAVGRLVGLGEGTVRQDILHWRGSRP